jgi:hypothetical protein
VRARLSAGLDALRRADWLTEDRARAYQLMLGTGVLLLGAALMGELLWPALRDPHWRPVASDFDAFWSGALLAAQGHAALAYDETAIRAAEIVGAQPTGADFFPYLYPPVFLLLCLPLGLLPYLAAMAAFLAGGFAATAACLRRILPTVWPALSILAFPAAMMNAVIGQNGFVSATAFGAAMLWLETRPALAGACLGVFAFKPHLALCVPVALLAARRWAAALACAATACLLPLASWAALGSAAWRGFLGGGALLRAVLHSPQIWPKLVSTYGAVQVLHGGIATAAAVQAGASLLAIACVAAVCRRRPGAGPEVATLVSAAMLCTPYVMDYDLVCLGVPMAWLAAQGVRHGWRDWEKIVLAALYVYPLVARTLNLRAGLPLTPALLLALLALVCRRAMSPDGPPVGS